MNRVKTVLFDCFGTVFDVRSLPKGYVREYAEHVRSKPDEPYTFADEWFGLPAHPGVSNAMQALQRCGLRCVAFSNGDPHLLQTLAIRSGFNWNHIIDIKGNHFPYKPHLDTYSLPSRLGYKPANTIMVTANKTFGDIEGATDAGMRAVLVDGADGYGYGAKPILPTIIDLADKLIANDKYLPPELIWYPGVFGWVEIALPVDEEE